MTEQIGNLTFKQPISAAHRSIITPDACLFIADLVRNFATERQTLLANREDLLAAFDSGQQPNFLAETADTRNADWQIAALPNDLQKRVIEITGPVDRKMVINALNADVDAFMADFEDSMSPTWQNIIEGQINLADAVAGTISFRNEAGKEYRLNPNPAVLMCRVRGLHLPEKHVLLDGTPIPGCLFDFGMYLYHNATALLAQHTGPYFYIPKLESHLEAKWWNDVIVWAQNYLDLPLSTVRVTCLIETLPAVFQMNEILFALKDHIAALNCGRWDYIFSHIKTLRRQKNRIMPNREVVGMTSPFLAAYSRLLIYTCHRRGALAMGGMSAFIPSRDAAANAEILAKVSADKLLEAQRGHDGAWVAHPGLAQVARNAFETVLKGQPNQIDVIGTDDAAISADELLAMPTNSPTSQGVRTNIRIALQYLAAWLSGNGCVPIYGLMEDAATAEISRSSLWQLVQHSVALEDGTVLSVELFQKWLAEEQDTVAQAMQAQAMQSQAARVRLPAAAALLLTMVRARQLDNFLTLPAYKLL